MRRSIAVFSLLLVTALLPRPGLAAANREGSAPDFALPTPAGTVSLHDLRGKVVFVDFWASWCGPCRQSFPWMSNMSDRYGSEGLVIVSINLDKTREAANLFLDRFTPRFTVAFDPAGKTAEAFHVEAMPSSFVVSREGRIVYEHQGFEPATAGVIESHIKEALAK